jgi:hypothetical protein
MSNIDDNHQNRSYMNITNSDNMQYEGYIDEILSGMEYCQPISSTVKTCDSEFNDTSGSQNMQNTQNIDVLFNPTSSTSSSSSSSSSMTKLVKNSDHSIIDFNSKVENDPSHLELFSCEYPDCNRSFTQVCQGAKITYLFPTSTK